MNTVFIPGLRLSGEFYREIVRPILDSHFPGLAHAAALIDGGSEVLGFDDEISVDHHWGPRLMLFLSGEDHPRYSEQISQVLANHLPYEFRGYPTNFTEPTPGDDGVQLLRPITQGPVNHRVAVHTVHSFFTEYLGFDIQQPLEPADWLTFSEQRLRTITTGSVFHDEAGLNAARSRFAYYPQDVWLYLLAAAWTRIGQEEPLMGRAGMVADEVGSALIGARLVRDVMRLCFLDGKDLRTLSEMVWVSIQTIVMREDSVACFPGRSTLRNLANLRKLSCPSVRICRRAPQCAQGHRAFA